MSELKPLTEAETTELLDWVSACQTSYHIDSTPGHRFGGLGINLQENRESLVEYVNELIAARAQPAQAGQVLTDEEIEAAWYECDDYETKRAYFDAGVHWAQKAVLAKRVPMTNAQIEHALRSEPMADNEESFALGIRHAERHHGIVGEKGGA